MKWKEACFLISLWYILNGMSFKKSKCTLSEYYFLPLIWIISNQNWDHMKCNRLAQFGIFWLQGVELAHFLILQGELNKMCFFIMEGRRQLNCDRSSNHWHPTASVVALSLLWWGVPCLLKPVSGSLGLNK